MLYTAHPLSIFLQKEKYIKYTKYTRKHATSAPPTRRVYLSETDMESSDTKVVSQTLAQHTSLWVCCPLSRSNFYKTDLALILPNTRAA